MNNSVNCSTLLTGEPPIKRFDPKQGAKRLRLGPDLPQPWRVLGKAPEDWTEDDEQVVSSYQDAFNAALQLEAMTYRLEAEILRLKHENEFMLRLVNERDKAVEDMANRDASDA